MTDPWESNFGKTHSSGLKPILPAPGTETRRFQPAVPLKPAIRPAALDYAVILLVTSFLVSVYVTLGSVDHLEHTLQTMPGTGDIAAMVKKYKWLAWGLLAADIGSNLLFMPGIYKGKRSSRRGIAWVAVLEGLFNMPGLPGYLDDAKLLALAIVAQTLLQLGACWLLYGGAREWFPAKVATR